MSDLSPDAVREALDWFDNEQKVNLKGWTMLNRIAWAARAWLASRSGPSDPTTNPVLTNADLVVGPSDQEGDPGIGLNAKNEEGRRHDEYHQLL